MVLAFCNELDERKTIQYHGRWGGITHNEICVKKATPNNTITSNEQKNITLRASFRSAALNLAIHTQPSKLMYEIAFVIVIVSNSTFLCFSRLSLARFFVRATLVTHFHERLPSVFDSRM